MTHLDEPLVELLDRAVEVDGVPVRYRVTGNGTRDIVLVHGHLAHSMWWHAIAPVLEPGWRVIQLDLSGHGDSGHREHYGVRQWSEDIIGVLDDIGSTSAVLLAHSLGGLAAIAVAAQQQDRIAGLIVIDTFFSRPGTVRPEIPERPQGRASAYPTWEEAAARFRLMPPQPPLPAHLIQPIVDNALRPADGGWTWKFDRFGRLQFDYEFVLSCVELLDLPILYLHGEHSSVVTREVVAGVRTVFPPTTTYVEIAGGYHHLILDSVEQCRALILEHADAMLGPS